MPADDQAMALPCASVMVIIVLLKLAFTCATPAVMFLRSRRRRRCGSRAIECCPNLFPFVLGPGFQTSSAHPEWGLSEGEGPYRRTGLFLLAGDRLGLALAGASVGVGALAADREALPVADTAVGGEVHQPLDVHRGLAAKVALDLVVGVDRLSDLEDFLVGQVLD